LSDVTRILTAIEQGDPQAAAQLLPLVYEELRQLAAQKLAHEKPGQTLQATALVHEAYLRLVQEPDAQARESWNSRGHFFAAAAESMRRILVENARRKKRHKHGGDMRRVEASVVVRTCTPTARKSMWRACRETGAGAGTFPSTATFPPFSPPMPRSSPNYQGGPGRRNR
jgi:RNA polymerase sigma factor (TIGR02999 family)